VFCVFDQGDAMRALARWRHPLASSEALDVLHQVMCPALHRRICMVIEIITYCLRYGASPGGPKTLRRDVLRVFRMSDL